jgi:hypothetical protein
VQGLEKKMNERGYLEGSEMAGTFNMLRANDLIWSFVVNNYLMGKDPFPFDLLYWNSDSTRMPARMHSFYLRNMYMKNLLKEPGGIELDGVPIDLGKIKVPTYFISTIEDHIAPWKSTYLGARRWAATCASCSAARATSPASSTRRRQQVRLLDQQVQIAARHRRRVDGRHRAAAWFVVDRLAGLGHEARSGDSRRARPCQGQARRARGRAGFLRQAATGREEGLSGFVLHCTDTTGACGRPFCFARACEAHGCSIYGHASPECEWNGRRGDAWPGRPGPCGAWRCALSLYVWGGRCSAFVRCGSRGAFGRCPGRRAGLRTNIIRLCRALRFRAGQA